MPNDMTRVSSRREQQRLEGEHVEPAAAMTDLTPERLRNEVCLTSKLDWQEHVALARQAADEIDALAAQNAILREALEAAQDAVAMMIGGRARRINDQILAALAATPETALTDREKRARSAAFTDACDAILALAEKND